MRDPSPLHGVFYYNEWTSFVKQALTSLISTHFSCFVPFTQSAVPHRGNCLIANVYPSITWRPWQNEERKGRRIESVNIWYNENKFPYLNRERVVLPVYGHYCEIFPARALSPQNYGLVIDR